MGWIRNLFSKGAPDPVTIEPPDMSTVRRVHTESGSHIEPPLDQGWDDLTKLRWQAAVVREDCGVDVTVQQGNLARLGATGEWEAVPDVYAWNVNGCGGGVFSFSQMWTYLNGVRLGAETVRRELETEEL